METPKGGLVTQVMEVTIIYLGNPKGWAVFMGMVSEVKNIETPKGGLVRWVVVQVTATWRPQRAVWIDVVIKM